MLRRSHALLRVDYPLNGQRILPFRIRVKSHTHRGVLRRRERTEANSPRSVEVQSKHGMFFEGNRRKVQITKIGMKGRQLPVMVNKPIPETTTGDAISEEKHFRSWNSNFRNIYSDIPGLCVVMRWDGITITNGMVMGWDGMGRGISFLSQATIPSPSL